MINNKDMVELSTLHAYANHEKKDKFTVNGNNYVVEEIFNEKNGMVYGTDAMLIRNDQDEYALIFTGSDKRDDFVNDWIVNNGGNLLNIGVPQYKEGNMLYEELSKQYNISSVGGVSLGGGVATYVGINNSEVDVVSINPSPQVVPVLENHRNITTIIDKNDFLFTGSYIFGRRKRFTKDIYFFSRGNNFFDSIKLNHVGYDKSNNLYLDDIIPFDLLSGNLDSKLIDINTNDIKVLNDNLKTYFDAIANEASVGVKPNLKLAIAEIKDDVSLQNIMVSIIDNVSTYLISSLPTLHSYFDFSFIFEELKELTDTKLFLILAELVDKVIADLNLTAINNQIKTDSIHGLSNLKSLDSHINNTANNCNLLVSNISYKDQNKISGDIPVLYQYKLEHSKESINLSYAFLFEKAKQVLYYSMRNVVDNNFVPVETMIDTAIQFINVQVGIIGSVAGLISKELSSKVKILESILDEFYKLDLANTIYNVFFISVEEIISVVLCKDIDKKISSFKYLTGLLQNAFSVYSNYEDYLLKYNSLGVRNLDNSIKNFKENFTSYNNYLSMTYN